MTGRQEFNVSVISSATSTPRCFRVLFVLLAASAAVFGAATWASAHRSGCHTYHSCPADTDSYVCGDKGYCGSCPDNQYCRDKKYWAKPQQVVRVVDGDTVTVRVNGKNEKVRLLGINAPETVDPRKPVECFGREAAARAKQLLAGQKVKLEPDATQGDRDKYGRLPRFVYLNDGMDVGEKLIREGYAYEYTYRSPYRHQQNYRTAQAAAQDAKRGLWADGVCGATSIAVPLWSTTDAIATSPAVVESKFINYVFGADVATDDRDIIRSGVAAADKRLTDWFGRGLNKGVAVRVEMIGGDGCCEVGEDTTGLAAFFRTGNPEWMQARLAAFLLTDLRRQMAAHEYVHLWQGENGCGPQHKPVALRWLMEGMAEWLSFQALAADGYVRDADWREFLRQRLKISAPVGSLKDYESEHRGADYSMFAFAVDRLMTKKPVTTLGNFCTQLGAGDAGPQAFESVFGIRLDEFYADFAVYRSGL